LRPRPQGHPVISSNAPRHHTPPTDKMTLPVAKPRSVHDHSDKLSKHDKAPSPSIALSKGSCYTAFAGVLIPLRPRPRIVHAIARAVHLCDFTPPLATIPGDHQAHRSREPRRFGTQHHQITGRGVIRHVTLTTRLTRTISLLPAATGTVLGPYPTPEACTTDNTSPGHFLALRVPRFVGDGFVDGRLSSRSAPDTNGFAET
jgi:hypothetical protein